MSLIYWEIVYWSYKYMYIIGCLVWCLVDVYICRLIYGFIFFMKNNNLKKNYILVVFILIKYSKFFF